jgi:hypothetical protein
LGAKPKPGSFCPRSVSETSRLILLPAPCRSSTLAAIAKKLPEIPAGSSVLGFNYDTGERYISVDAFLPTE